MGGSGIRSRVKYKHAAHGPVLGNRENFNLISSIANFIQSSQPAPLLQLSLHLDPSCLLPSTQTLARRSTTRSPTPDPPLLDSWLTPPAPLRGSGRRTAVKKRGAKPKRRPQPRPRPLRLAAQLVSTRILCNPSYADNYQTRQGGQSTT